MPKATRRGVAQLHRTVSTRARDDRYRELGYDGASRTSWGEIRPPRRPIQWTERGALVVLIGVCVLVAVVFLAVCAVALLMTGSVR